MPARTQSSPWRTVYDFLEFQSQARSSAVAIAAPGKVPLSYGKLKTQVDAVIHYLNNVGLGRGDRIGVILPYGPEYAVATLAVIAGATCVPLNPDSRRPEYLRCFSEVEIDAVLVPAGGVSDARIAAKEIGLPIHEIRLLRQAEAGLFALPERVDRSCVHAEVALPDDLAYVLQTSGTTARPKTMGINHATACTRFQNIERALSLTPHDTYLNVMPLFHSTGLGLTLAALAAGGTAFCAPRFDPDLFPTLLRESDATWFTASPTMHHAILDSLETRCVTLGRHRLRFIRSSNAPLSQTLEERIKRTFRTSVIQGYGLTETGLIACGPLPPKRRKPGSVGLTTGAKITVLDAHGRSLPTDTVGEIAVRASTCGVVVTAGSELRTAASRDSWFRTGDLGYLDSEDYLYLVDRQTNFINCGGQKVSPTEVEGVLLQHAAVREAVVFSMQDDLFGERVSAAVVLKDGSAVTTEQLQRFTASRLAGYKVPQYFVITDSIPKNALGKTDRTTLLDSFGDTLTNAPEARLQDAPQDSPASEIEVFVARVWSDVLGLPYVNLSDHVLQLGGSSIDMTQIASRLHQRFAVAIPLRMFFEAGTVKELARHIERVLAQCPQNGGHG